MKKTIRLLIALLLCLCLPTLCASAETDAGIEGMLPAFDSVMRVLLSDEAVYQPRDPEFFWDALYLMAVNWGYDHPLAKIDDDTYELILRRATVQEMATALFADYDDLLPVPDSFSELAVYDDSLDAYRFPLSDAGESYVEIESVAFDADGGAVVVVQMKSYAEPGEVFLEMRFELVPNAYAGGISEVSFLYSVVSAERTEQTPA